MFLLTSIHTMTGNHVELIDHRNLTRFKHAQITGASLTNSKSDLS